MTNVNEIAPDVYRISTYVPQGDLVFNQFLVNDDEPLLWHTGMKSLFPAVREAVSGIIDPSKLRWISFSHFEADECGALNEWLAVAPEAQAFCTFCAAVVNMGDFASRPVRPMGKEDVVSTGKYRFRLIPTPQLPHAWDAGLLFEETQRTLFCSDLFHHNGDPEPVTNSDITGKAKALLELYQHGPLNNYFPYTPHTEPMLNTLADLKPNTLAVMHGSSYNGDCEGSLRQLAGIMAEVLG